MVTKSKKKSVKFLEGGKIIEKCLLEKTVDHKKVYKFLLKKVKENMQCERVLEINKERKETIREFVNELKEKKLLGRLSRRTLARILYFDINDRNASKQSQPNIIGILLGRRRAPEKILEGICFLYDLSPLDREDLFYIYKYNPDPNSIAIQQDVYASHLPVYVTDKFWNIQYSNTYAEKLYDFERKGKNILLYILSMERKILVDWQEHLERVIAQFKDDYRDSDEVEKKRFEEIIEKAKKYKEFYDLWEQIPPRRRLAVRKELYINGNSLKLYQTTQKISNTLSRVVYAICDDQWKIIENSDTAQECLNNFLNKLSSQTVQTTGFVSILGMPIEC